jgi:hypothetical protein
MPKSPDDKIGSLAAIIGAALLLVGTCLHPMQADPNIPSAAFAEYAADRHWVASHLTQLFGAIATAAALVLLSRRLADGPAAGWAALGMAGAIASLATASALQAVDGVALKAAVDGWAAAPEPDRSAPFHAAVGVRQIELGLASVTGVLFGLTSSVYGIALLGDRRFPKWLGVLAIAGGVPTVVAGIAMAYTGFSELAMLVQMPAMSLLVLWMAALGVCTWKRSAA